VNRWEGAHSPIPTHSDIEHRHVATLHPRGDGRRRYVRDSFGAPPVPDQAQSPPVANHRDAMSPDLCHLACGARGLVPPSATRITSRL
jgi:hypothetical protein